MIDESKVMKELDTLEQHYKSSMDKLCSFNDMIIYGKLEAVTIAKFIVQRAIASVNERGGKNGE